MEAIKNAKISQMIIEEMNRGAYIGQMRICAQSPYIVYSPCAGLISQHRTLSGARRADRRRSAGCRAQGGYSDAAIYEYADGAWCAVDPHAD